MRTKLSKTSLFYRCQNESCASDAIQPWHFREHFIAYVVHGTPLPEELADLFAVSTVEVDDGLRGIVDWA
jgi:hypothetical protein